MNFLNINFETHQSIVNSFDTIAKKLFSDTILIVNDASYRLTDIEFYCFATDKFEDPFTYKHKMQLENGKIYLHGSGVDITCGNGQNHCGILIRGVARLYEGAGPDQAFIKEQFEGPHKVATELLSNLHRLLEDKENKIQLLDIKGDNQNSLLCLPKHILKSKRVRLTSKIERSSEYFKNLPLRYLLFTPVFKMKFRSITKILIENIVNGNITRPEANEIIGYKITPNI